MKQTKGQVALDLGHERIRERNKTLLERVEPNFHQSPSTTHVSPYRAVYNQYIKAQSWYISLRIQFGTSFLLQIFGVYFTQGIRSTLCSLGTSYFLNETLHFTPSEAESIRAAASIPWIIKPVYGILSDSIPLFGTRRKSYLIIFSTLTTLAYLALALPNLIHSHLTTLISLFIASIGIAFCDVVIDGRVVEASRGEKEDSAGDLQTLSWLSLSVGSVFGALCSGTILNTFGPRGVFFVSALGPACISLFTIKIDEKRCDFINLSNQSIIQLITTHWNQLLQLLQLPLCWRPIVWIFLSNAIAPNLNEAMFAFKTKELLFSKSFLGFLSIVGSLTLLSTTAMYNIYFRNVSFRSIFFYVQLVSAALSFSEYVLVTRWNIILGFGDGMFILGDEVVSDAVGRLKHMPSLILCAKICPVGVEGTMFAVLMSLYNFSWSVSSYLGSYLVAHLKISQEDFSGLGAAVLIRSVAKLLPLGLLFMVPERITRKEENLKDECVNV